MKALVLFLMISASLAAVGVRAHGGEEHVIGTVASVTPDSIIVKTTANKMVTVGVVAATTFMMGKMAMKNGDLKVGNRVVIHAKEIKEGTLVADTVDFSTANSAPAAASHAPAAKTPESATGH